MKEIWKPINLKEFNDSHLVSNLGRVKTTKGRILKQRFDRDGYYQVNLYNKGLEKTKKVHRIVALTFLSDHYEDSLVVNHKDGVKTNNVVSNLEFTTISGNTQHAYDMNLEGKGADHAASIQTALYRKGQLISQYETIKDFEFCSGMSRGRIKHLMDNKILDIVKISEIDYTKPVNRELNKGKQIFTPIEISDSDYNVIAIYTSGSVMERCSSIPRKTLDKLEVDHYYRYKKRGKQYKNFYYIRIMPLIDFLLSDSNLNNKIIKLK